MTDVTLSQVKRGTRTTKTIKTSQATAGFTMITVSSISGGTPIIPVSSGALTANTLAQVFSHTGSGKMTHFTARNLDATARTMRLKVTIDGATSFDYTSASIAGSGSGVILAGVSSAASTSIIPELEWETGITIEWASNANETAKFGAEYVWQELK